MKPLALESGPGTEGLVPRRFKVTLLLRDRSAGLCLGLKLQHTLPATPGRCLLPLGLRSSVAGDQVASSFLELLEGPP